MDMWASLWGPVVFVISFSFAGYRAWDLKRDRWEPINAFLATVNASVYNKRY